MDSLSVRHRHPCKPLEPVLPLDSVIKSLKSSIVDVDWLLREIESQQGWFRFPPFLTNAISNLKIQAYPLLYTNERSISGVFFRGFLTPEETQDFGRSLDAASLTERGELLLEAMVGLEEVLDRIEIPKTPAEEKAARKQFMALPETEQKEAVRLGQHFFMFFLSSFFQTLSVMVHGEKLTSLVSQAMHNNDEAFVKAVQIDRRILTEIPYFKERFARAQDEGHQDFFDQIAYRLQNAPYRGCIRYKSLWYVLAMLDQSGWLNQLTYREIREVCDEVALSGYESRIQSDKHLGNRVREYREFQKRGFVTTT